jgi:hypothetical protein
MLEVTFDAEVGIELANSTVGFAFALKNPSQQNYFVGFSG